MRTPEASFVSSCAAMSTTTPVDGTHTLPRQDATWRSVPLPYTASTSHQPRYREDQHLALGCGSVARVCLYLRHSRIPRHPYDRHSRKLSPTNGPPVARTHYKKQHLGRDCPWPSVSPPFSDRRSNPPAAHQSRGGRGYSLSEKARPRPRLKEGGRTRRRPRAQSRAREKSLRR